ncbi:UBA/TS-N domain containing protein [Moelleriella libera RCEF 2490]|uniref:UBA/TS-N domain containing protein n=1 Tax=Moelleriella libera RCEF 2490 TaxID=1081109 RepID=A0A166V5T4_9HYPO|nr:UBA/TS-N domain containing protein [Moelleriella libera RCEF 2490]
MPSDLEVLADMGFDKARAELAVKKSGGLQGALQWLEDNQDKSIEEIQATQADEAEDDDDAETKAKIAELETGQARSLVCNDCGKKFRNHDLATFHATKTEHTDFAESTEDIAPLTDTEKKARLDELRERLQAKRAAQSVQDKVDAKRNEQIRLKSTKETQDVKEELARKEQIKEAARKRQEKQDDLDAKKRIKAKIEADKAERRRKADEAKAAREGKTIEPEAPAPPPAAKPKTSHAQARLRLQTPSGNLIKTLPPQTTLSEVARMVQEETGHVVTKFAMAFPRRTIEGEAEMSQTLEEASLTPSAVLLVR